MTTSLAPSPSGPSTTSDEGLDHIYCCDPDTALCGTDISGYVERPALGDVDCIVCDDLEFKPCLTCGT